MKTGIINCVKSFVGLIFIITAVNCANYLLKLNLNTVSIVFIEVGILAVLIFGSNFVTVFLSAVSFMAIILTYVTLGVGNFFIMFRGIAVKALPFLVAFILFYAGMFLAYYLNKEFWSEVHRSKIKKENKNLMYGMLPDLQLFLCGDDN